MRKLARAEEKRGLFVAVEGDIDKRSEDKLDTELQPGFKIDCGLRGSKLSGG